MLRTFPPSISRGDTERLRRLLGGSETGYAIQERDTQTGSWDLVLHGGPLGHELLEAHLLGNLTLGVLLLSADNTVKATGLTLRPDDFLSRQGAKQPSCLLLWRERAAEQAVRLVRRAAPWGLPLAAEEAGPQELRVWLFLREPVHFLKARRLMNALVEQVPAHSFSSRLEPLMPTRPVGLGWEEQAVLLPLGLDRATGHHSRFLATDGFPAAEQLSFLKGVRDVDFESARKAVSAMAAPARSPVLPVPAAPTLPREVAKLKDNCAVLSRLMGALEERRAPRRMEEAVLFELLAPLEGGEETLHRLLSPFPGYDADRVARRATRLKTYAVRCARLRSQIPQWSEGACHCAFDLRGGRIPSPLLHVHPHLSPVEEAWMPAERLSLREAARRYIAVRRQLAEWDRLGARLESVLNELFERRTLSSFCVDGVTLRCLRESDGAVRWDLDM